MSSYLSSLLTHTTTHYTTLKRTLLKDESDGPTEDDSHISRVLRAYYTEKAQPLPPWLPADPNDRRANSLQTSSQAASGSAPGRNQFNSSFQAPGNRGSLSSLWDSDPAPAQPAPQSLRAPRQPRGARPELASAASEAGLAVPRPLPSQRAGSYQSVGSNASAEGAGTAQDRLKARLWGGARGGGQMGGRS